MTIPKKPIRRNRWEQFYDFIQSPHLNNLTILQQELRTWDIDLNRVQKSVSEIVYQSRSNAQPRWLERARVAQARFDRDRINRSDWVSQQFETRRQMINAITSGQLGPRVQKQALVFFRKGRNLLDASEADLRSFLDDCQVLGILDPPGLPKKREGNR